MIDNENELANDPVSLKRRLALAHDALNVIGYYPNDDGDEHVQWLKDKALEALEKDEDAATGLILSQIRLDDVIRFKGKGNK
jgi:hypothetical protein